MPQMIVLMKQIKKYPPLNITMGHLMERFGDKSTTGATMRNQLDKSLGKIPNVRYFSKVKPGLKKLNFNSKGGRIVKIIHKKTGKRVL